MSGPASIVLLCEDQAHRSFVRGWLEQAGYETRRMRELPVPAGRGAGSKHVLDRYPREVAAARARAAKSSCMLIVVIDADAATVANRLADLGRTLTAARVPPRALAGQSPTESIYVLIPRRNVETWAVWLTTTTRARGAIDEVEDYKAEVDASEVREAGRELARQRGTTAKGDLPSLSHARAELNVALARDPP